MRKIIITGALLVLVAGALSYLDYGFYNPKRGVAGAGRDENAKDPHERELLPVTISDEDVQRFNGHPTLANVAQFYGTEESLRCSVNAMFSTTDIAVAQRPLRRGMVVILCLN
jgi:hypothetical protein